MATVRELVGQLQILIGLQSSSRAQAEVQRLDAVLQKAQERAKLASKYIGGMRLPQNLGHFARFAARFTSTRDLENARQQFAKLTAILGEPKTKEEMLAQVAAMERYKDILETLSPKQAQAIGEARKQLRTTQLAFAVQGEMPEHLKKVDQTWRSVADQAARSREAIARVSASIAAVGAASTKNVLSMSDELDKFTTRVLDISEVWDNLKASTRGLELSPQFQRQLAVGDERIGQLLQQTDKLSGLMETLKSPFLEPKARANVLKEFQAGLKAAGVLVRELGISFSEVARQANIALRTIPGAGARQIEFTARELKALAMKFKPGMDLTAIKADSQARASALQKIQMLTAAQRKELERAVIATRALLQQEKLYKLFKTATNLELAKQHTLLGRIAMMAHPILSFFSRWHQAIDELAFRTFTVFITYMNFRQVIGIIRGLVEAWMDASRALASLASRGFPEARRQAEELARTMGVSLQTASQALDAAAATLTGAGLRLGEIIALAPQLARTINQYSLALQVPVPEAAQRVRQAMEGNIEAIRALTAMSERQAQQIAQMAPRLRARRLMAALERSAERLPVDPTAKAMRDAAEATRQLSLEMGRVLAALSPVVAIFAKTINLIMKIPLLKETIGVLLALSAAFLGLSLPFQIVRIFFGSALGQMVKSAIVWIWQLIRSLFALRGAMIAVSAARLAIGGIQSVVTLVGALGGALGPLGLVVLGISAVIGVVALLITKFKVVQDVFRAVWQFLVQGWNAVANTIGSVFGWLWNIIKKFIDLVVGAFSWLWDYILKPIVDFFGGILGITQPQMSAAAAAPTAASAVQAQPLAASVAQAQPALAVAGAAPTMVATTESRTLAPALQFYVNVNVNGVTDVGKAREQAPLLAHDIWVQIQPHLDRYLLQIMRGDQEHRPADERWRRP